MGDEGLTLDMDGALESVMLCIQATISTTNHDLLARSKKYSSVERVIIKLSEKSGKGKEYRFHYFSCS